MQKRILSLVLGISILAAACKKENTVEKVDNKSLSELVVPASFNWQTVKNVNLSIGISDTRFQNKLFVVAIYLNDPATDLSPIAKGSATKIAPFNTVLSIPATVNEVYVVKYAPDGSSTTEKVALTSAKVSVALSAVSTSYKLSSISNNVVAMPAPIEPICGMTVTDPNVKIANATDVICFNATGDVTINVEANSGGTLKLNASGHTITLGNVNHTGLNIFIAKGTTVQFGNDYEVKSTEVLTNNGTLLGNNLSLTGKLYNSGTTTFSGGNFNLNSGSELTNAANGVFTVSSQNPSVNSLLTNNGKFTFNSVVVNGDGAIVNNCSLTINDKFTVSNNKVDNYKLIEVKGDTYVNSGGVINLYNGAMHQTKTLTVMDGNVVGLGTTQSLFKVLETVGDNVLNNNGLFKGNLQYSGTKDLNDNQNKKNHFSDGAVQGNSVYIEKDECNSIGNGTPLKPDTDKDGVWDDQDAYPNDPTKAYNCYSNNYENGGTTFIFEDSWPKKADYDLNDVVLTFKHKVITNKDNIVVRVEAEWNLIAAGGEFKNGAAVQFSLLKSNATNFVSSNKLSPEEGQDSLVVILFKNSKEELASWNTIPGQAVSPSKKYTFSFDVTNGPNVESVGAGSINPFIWNGSEGYGRGYETHLYGRNPTKLANTALFGTEEDNSKTGTKYTTAKNLPWALELPTADFQYPVEFKDITTAYLQFYNWAQSGGTLSTKWYSETGSDYRNTGNIYTGK